VQSAEKPPTAAEVIKTEPATPLPTPDELAPIPSTEVRRARRGTLLGAYTPPTARTSKRKRDDNIDDMPEDALTPQLPTRPNYVLGTRNFARVANPVMHDISTHKHASKFAKPITEREAPGYRELMYRPQDLKSIRGLMSAGSKAISAADAAGEEVATPGSANKSTNIWLERSAEVMPPKAIVNSAQLEKEIVRVFANAVMFNPDPKRGVGPAFGTRARVAEARQRGEEVDEDEMEEKEVEDDGGGQFTKDTREMYEDVEQKVGQWRAAERVSDERGGKREAGGEESEVVEATVEEAEEATKGRRRE